MSVMLVVRGVTQVAAIQLTRGADLSIAGLAGISHILMALALGYLFVALKTVAKRLEKNN
ncbi:MAG: DUF2871 family protein [Candidatus Saccharibacteria bacterium]|nr:DUF2871 family protein [Candidatus Saccharibacteria bacterium]